uniref:Uncharacterized protein n=1 Tax=Salix viminalis TaxID=40686 RepID=A0A6N2LUU8_SALVM
MASGNEIVRPTFMEPWKLKEIVGKPVSGRFWRDNGILERKVDFWYVDFWFLPRLQEDMQPCSTLSQSPASSEEGRAL